MQPFKHPLWKAIFWYRLGLGALNKLLEGGKKSHKEGFDAITILSSHVLQSVHTNTSCFIYNIDLDGMLSISAGLPAYNSL